jgi:hypothetical protein
VRGGRGGLKGVFFPAARGNEMQKRMKKNLLVTHDVIQKSKKLRRTNQSSIIKSSNVRSLFSRDIEKRGDVLYTNVTVALALCRSS